MTCLTDLTCVRPRGDAEAEEPEVELAVEEIVLDEQKPSEFANCEPDDGAALLERLLHRESFPVSGAVLEEVASHVMEVRPMETYIAATNAVVDEVEPGGAAFSC